MGEILDDLGKPDRMLRLLQGDVGAGKTVVALLAMARAAEARGQSALMAPTEILARQHFATIKPLAERAGLTAVILTGREKGRDREAALAIGPIIEKDRPADEVVDVVIDELEVREDLARAVGAPNPVRPTQRSGTRRRIR